MKATTQLWGNSLALRIPAPVARDTNLANGSQVDLTVEEGRIVLTPLRRKKRVVLASLLSKVKASNLPSSDPWGEQMGREIW